jgi:threonine dehydrogenase-like Zn-dependent dehydrogenase
MKAIRWVDREVLIDDVPDPAGDGVVLDVSAASICGTDLAYMRTLSPSPVLGHEFGGWIDGTPYAIEPTVFCGVCDECRSGYTNRCIGPHQNIGINRDGGVAERVLVPSYSLVELPEGLDARDACLVEPTSVAWHGVRRAAIEVGERVVVVGGGSIGLLAVGCVRHLGCDVALEARHMHQREAGERLGAQSPAGEFDVVIETAGSESGLVRSAELVRPGGRVILLGNFIPTAPIPGIPTLVKEISWIGSIGRCRHDGGVRESDESAAVLAANPELPRTIITHRFPLSDAREAFRVAGDRSGGVIKVALEP